MPLFFKKHTFVPLVLVLVFVNLPTSYSYGQSKKQSENKNKKTYSTNTTGMLGLNTVPSARMDNAGTIRAGISTLDPYIHGYLGFQITPSFYLNFRQTAEVSSLNKPAKRNYPGVDFKLRLTQESDHVPEISLGMNSAFGHKKMASEYIAFSKRYKNFDLTGGMAWGRLGSSAHLKNPLRAISPHFGNKRSYISENSNSINDWFTGEDIGFFGGVEYFTPINGLSLKAEYSADNYQAETLAFDYNSPSPWSIGINYQPWRWIDLSTSVIGTDKVMARVSLQKPIQDWWGTESETDAPLKLKNKRAGEFNKKGFETALKSQKFSLNPIYNKENKKTSKASLELSSYRSTGEQIGRAMRLMENQIPNNSTDTTIALKHKGLRGPDIKIIRNDVRKAISNHQGSPEEIWRDTQIKTKNLVKLKPQLSIKPMDFRFILDTRLSLSEEDVGALYRTSAIFETEQEWPLGIISGFSGRLNLKDNLEDLEFIRELGNLVNNIDNPQTRSNVESFAAQRFTLENSYISWLKSLNTNTHLALTTGLLEEMFGGIGGEILYRPFGKKYALGGEIWRVAPRNPFSTLGMDLFDDNRNTGHLNFWYELPDNNTTFFAKVGQYLGKDFGATLGLETKFKNGATMKAFVTGTDKKDIDVFGSTTQLNAGLQINFPIGNIPYIPDGSAIRTGIEPIGRDTGQTLEKPISLYSATEPMSYRAITQSWTDLLQ